MCQVLVAWVSRRHNAPLGLDNRIEPVISRQIPGSDDVTASGRTIPTYTGGSIPDSQSGTELYSSNVGQAMALIHPLLIYICLLIYLI